MNACEMYVLSEDMEYQCVAEDSKTRIYLSLVRTKDQRLQRNKEIQRRRFKRKLIRRAVIIGAEIVKLLVAFVAMMVMYQILWAYLLEWRGQEAIGSELAFTGIFGIAVWWLMDLIIGGGYDYM